uniref:Transposase n=1 Tax=Rhabditophanes sp. KR3021 TaxID=114890 RepID=A0AC35TQE5_9BILA
MFFKRYYTEDVFIDRSSRWFKHPVKASLNKAYNKKLYHKTRFARADSDIAPAVVVPAELPDHEFFEKVSETGNTIIVDGHFGSKKNFNFNALSGEVVVPYDSKDFA